MHDQAKLALRWLLGREEPAFEKVRDQNGKLVEQLVSQEPGLKELISILRSGDEIPADIRNALASALEPVGVSHVKLTLVRSSRRRGRPPHEVKRVVEQQKIKRAFESRSDPHPKVDVDVEHFAKSKGLGKSTAYRILNLGKSPKVADDK